MATTAVIVPVESADVTEEKDEVMEWLQEMRNAVQELAASTGTQLSALQDLNQFLRTQAETTTHQNTELLRMLTESAARQMETATSLIHQASPEAETPEQESVSVDDPPEVVAEVVQPESVDALPSPRQKRRVL